ncbi:MAG: hypothetical protein N3C12_08110 [Candidatus Binatia bacterium]|nr:hypothetical protein [Candidatus Binatia bacterium]
MGALIFRRWSCCWAFFSCRPSWSPACTTSHGGCSRSVGGDARLTRSARVVSSATRHYLSRRRVSVPIYEYLCPKCGEFEVTQRITDDPLKRCPRCRSKVQKLISASSFQLKGSGWYLTDYARAGSNQTKSDGSEKAGEIKSSSAETSSSKASDQPAA